MAEQDGKPDAQARRAVRKALDEIYIDFSEGRLRFAGLTLKFSANRMTGREDRIIQHIDPATGERDWNPAAE